MEEAYTALYQEFLRLRSLCLKQAAMLQHLTETLKKQQGLTDVPNGDVESLISALDQCTHNHLGLSPYPDRGHVPMTEAVQNAKTSGTVLESHGEVSDLAGGMSQLQVNPGVMQGTQAEDVSMSSQRHSGASAPSTILDDLREAEQRWYSSRTPQQLRRPWSSSFLDSELMSQAGGLLMSGVTLQSQVCEFCHAVFPGHTTTRGEYLRHLTTHIT
ncbi:TRAF family member-associated NF-kappa-B activator [Chanos chanos]|uniref:TRAF family member-associated NF-kappa-B activator n=1 Tax=Chanos chanos TaxID=29144 RepID=A0A6J2VQ14_CHACN|nr:TRAF family member-associated NF-kappa-B activator-like [Chanos chanos]